EGQASRQTRLRCAAAPPQTSTTTAAAAVNARSARNDRCIAAAKNTQAPALGRYSRRSAKIVPMGKQTFDTMAYAANDRTAHKTSRERRPQSQIATVANPTARAIPTRVPGSA